MANRPSDNALSIQPEPEVSELSPSDSVSQRWDPFADQKQYMPSDEQSLPPPPPQTQALLADVAAALEQLPVPLNDFDTTPEQPDHALQARLAQAPPPIGPPCHPIPSISHPVERRLAIETAQIKTLSLAGYPVVPEAFEKMSAYTSPFSLMAKDVKNGMKSIKGLLAKRAPMMSSTAEKQPATEEAPVPGAQSAPDAQATYTEGWWHMPAYRDVLHEMDRLLAPSVEQPRRQAAYKDSTAGGKARKKAEKEGRGQTFEDSVKAMLARLGFCSPLAEWYNSKHGYLCSFGNHHVSHHEIDAWAENPSTYLPRVCLVNTFNTPKAPFSPYIGLVARFYGAHPPDVDFDMPMHDRHKAWIEQARLSGMLSCNFDRCPCDDRLGTPHLTRKEDAFVDAATEHVMASGGLAAGAHGFDERYGMNH